MQFYTSLGSWLSVLGLYALGTATENSEYLVDTVEKIKKDMEEVRDELTKGGDEQGS